jgi:hypothetical protein
LLEDVAEVRTSITIVALVEHVITFLVEVSTHFALVLLGVTTDGTPYIEKIIVFALEHLKSMRDHGKILDI